MILGNESPLSLPLIIPFGQFFLGLGQKQISSLIRYRANYARVKFDLNMSYYKYLRVDVTSINVTYASRVSSVLILTFKNGVTYIAHDDVRAPLIFIILSQMISDAQSLATILDLIGSFQTSQQNDKVKFITYALENQIVSVNTDRTA